MRFAVPALCMHICSSEVLRFAGAIPPPPGHNVWGDSRGGGGYCCGACSVPVALRKHSFGPTHPPSPPPANREGPLIACALRPVGVQDSEGASTARKLHFPPSAAASLPQAGYLNRSKAEILCRGGRYDALLHRFRLQQSLIQQQLEGRPQPGPMVELAACGLMLDMTKWLEGMDKEKVVKDLGVQTAGGSGGAAFPKGSCCPENRRPLRRVPDTTHPRFHSHKPEGVTECCSRVSTSH